MAVLLDDDRDRPRRRAALDIAEVPHAVALDGPVIGIDVAVERRHLVVGTVRRLEAATAPRRKIVEDIVADDFARGAPRRPGNVVDAECEDGHAAGPVALQSARRCS